MRTKPSVRAAVERTHRELRAQRAGVDLGGSLRVSKDLVKIERAEHLTKALQQLARALVEVELHGTRLPLSEVALVQKHLGEVRPTVRVRHHAPEADGVVGALRDPPDDLSLPVN